LSLINSTVNGMATAKYRVDRMVVDEAGLGSGLRADVAAAGGIITISSAFPIASRGRA
jgi:hypothetical protein